MAFLETRTIKEMLLRDQKLSLKLFPGYCVHLHAYYCCSATSLKVNFCYITDVIDIVLWNWVCYYLTIFMLLPFFKVWWVSFLYELKKYYIDQYMQRMFWTSRGVVLYHLDDLDLIQFWCFHLSCNPIAIYYILNLSLESWCKWARVSSRSFLWKIFFICYLATAHASYHQFLECWLSAV